MRKLVLLGVLALAGCAKATAPQASEPPERWFDLIDVRGKPVPNSTLFVVDGGKSLQVESTCGRLIIGMAASENGPVINPAKIDGKPCSPEDIANQRAIAEILRSQSVALQRKGDILTVSSSDNGAARFEYHGMPIPTE